MDIKQRIEDLRRELHKHNDLYYIESNPEISDIEFDKMMRELQDLENSYPEYYDATSPTLRVGSDISNSFTQQMHRYPMLSLSNTYTINEVKDFLDRASNLLKEPFKVCAELKYDGTSISLTYIDGKLSSAVTRGDGEKGDVVTANVRTIRTVPLVLKGDYPEDFEIRGEILLPWKEFDRLNKEREEQEEPLFANPRNAASGTLKLQNSKIVAARKLEAILYYMLGADLPSDSHYENLQKAASWGFNVSKYTKLCNGIEDIEEFINYWDTERKNLPVATDGIVLKVDSLRQQVKLGYTAKSPRWAIAYKFQAERAESELLSVSFQVGRTGIITPVANLQPVQLSGTVVKRASLYNEDAINAMDLHIGDVCYVEKGGEIIPKIVGIALGERNERLGAKVSFITKCPVCNTPLVKYEGEVAYYCPNANGCAPQIKGRIEHFIARRAMNIDGVGPETVDSFFANSVIETYADLYKLDVDKIVSCPRIKSEDLSDNEPQNQDELNDDQDFGGLFAVKQTKKPSRRFTELVASKIVKSIEKSKTVPFERILFALGIRFVGETVAKKIAKHFKNIDSVISASFDELIEVEDVGERIAKSIIEFFTDNRNISMIDELKSAGVKMQVEEEAQLEIASDILKGASIVISGTFEHHSRDEYKAMIETNGSKNVSSISSKTDFILAGDNMGPSKLEKAKKLGIKIISENEFLDMIKI